MQTRFLRHTHTHTHRLVHSLKNSDPTLSTQALECFHNTRVTQHVSIVSCCHGVVNDVRQIGSVATRNGYICWHEETRVPYRVRPFRFILTGSASLPTSLCYSHETVRQWITKLCIPYAMCTIRAVIRTRSIREVTGFNLISAIMIRFRKSLRRSSVSPLGITTKINVLIHRPMLQWKCVALVDLWLEQARTVEVTQPQIGNWITCFQTWLSCTFKGLMQNLLLSKSDL